MKKNVSPRIIFFFKFKLEKADTFDLNIHYLYRIHVEDSVFQTFFIWIRIDPIENTDGKFR